MFVIIECNPDERGADSVLGVWGMFYTEDEVLDALANMRDDDPEYGNGWTYMDVHNV